MVIVVTRRRLRVPGTAETHPHEIREWTCRECDYFEEVADDDEAER
jgi:hypothetical protein